MEIQTPLVQFLGELGVCKTGGEMRRLIQLQMLYLDNELPTKTTLVDLSVPHVVEIRSRRLTKVWQYNPEDK